MTRILIAALVLSFTNQFAHAENNEKPLKPLWEVGAGFAAAIAPDYPGSSGSNSRILPVPFLIYRGDFLRIGDGSLASGRVYENKRLELDISLNGSLDAESDNVSERAGMSDLGFLFEVGPEAEIRLNDLSDENTRIKLELPLRAAFSVDDSDLNARGFVFSPQLEIERDYMDDRYELSASFTPTFASRKLMAYFYDVSPALATSERAAFTASGGYMQSTIGLSVKRRGERSFAVAGVRLTSLQGAKNEDASLLVSDTDFSVYVLAVWKLGESKKRARR